MSTAAVRPRAGTDAPAGRRAGHAARPRVPVRAEPWGRKEAAVPAVLVGLGAVGLVVGWYRVSGTVDLDTQVGWLAFGITALIVGGLGMVVWLLTGMRVVTDLKREVLTDLGRLLPAPAAAGSRAPGEPPADAFGTVAGMRRYHAADCLMLGGKEARWAPERDHVAGGLVPCGICLPGGTGAGPL